MADFEPDDSVQIDGNGKGTVIEKVRRGSETLYLVNICGTDYNCEVESNRLTPFTETRFASTKQTTRFQPVADSDIDQFIEGQSNKNTLSKTVYDLKILRQFLNTPEVGETREIQNIPVDELQNILCRFFIAIRKSNGDEYEPNTLRGIMASIDRQLRRFNYGEYLATGPNFAKVREVLKCKQKQLKRDGKGNLAHRADPITDAEVDMLWRTGEFGSSTPDAILQTLWFHNTVHFGLRGCTEHRAMCWGDIVLKTDSNGLEFLEFNERQTKTRTGSNPRDVRKVTAKLWSNAENPDRDPVLIYKMYASKRPVGYSLPDHPFYLALTTKHLPSISDTWFKRNPVGVNKLSTMMSRMSKNAGISTEKNLSNHSARKYLVQKLSDHNVPPNQIMQISGHKNVSSINNYSHLNEQQHSNISSILHSSSMNARSIEMCPNNHAAVSSVRSASSTSMQVHGGFSSIFASEIHGGSFEIHIHQHKSSPQSPHARKRIRLTADSDSE